MNCGPRGGVHQDCAQDLQAPPGTRRRHSCCCGCVWLQSGFSAYQANSWWREIHTDRELPVETINLQFRKRILQALEGIPTPAGQIEFLLTHVDLASPMPLPTGIPVDTSSRGIVSVRFLTKSSVLLRLLLFFLPKLAFFASGE